MLGLSGTTVPDWIGTAGITSFRVISVESKKLCCQDRMGIEIRNVCISQALLGLKALGQGTTLQ